MSTPSERALQGQRNRANGLQFEKIIEMSLSMHWSAGEAFITKTPEPVRVLTGMDRNGRFTGCFSKKAEPDYKGILRGGQGIMLEAKMTTTGKLQQDVIRPQQAKALSDYSAAGALCFVLASFGATDVYRVPWGDWLNAPRVFGRKYVTPRDLTGYLLPRLYGIYPDIIYQLRH